MIELTEQVREQITKSVDLDERLRDIFMRHYGLVESEDNKPDPAYMAYGLMGVEVAVSMARMFIAMRRDKGTLHVMQQLTYVLNGNKFWQNTAHSLVPLMQAAINARTDELFLETERATGTAYQQDDALILSARGLALEAFPLIGFFIGGPQVMAQSSIAIKRELAPYLMS